MEWLSRYESINLLGQESSEKLIRYAGAYPLYIPTKPIAGHALAEILGIGKMALLCRKFGGDYIHLPLPEKKTRRNIILENLGKGMSAKELAALANTSERYVYMVAAECKDVSEKHKFSREKRVGGARRG